MLLRLVRPMKRKGSSNVQFTKRIPSDLMARMVGMKLAVPFGEDIASLTIKPRMQTIRFSLKTSDPSAAKVCHAEAAAYLEKVFASLRENKPISLTHRQVVALSGRLYQSWAGDWENDEQISYVHTQSGWQRDYERFSPTEMKSALQSALDNLKSFDEAEPEELEKIAGPLVDRLLLSEGITEVDGPTRETLLLEFLKSLQQGMDVRRRKAGGDYSPDPQSERFPEWQAPGGGERRTAKSSTGFVSLVGLIDGWWKEAEAAGRSQSTYESYKKAVSTFAAFLKHDDAGRITTDDVIAFKDQLLATPEPRTGRPRSLKTVKDSYLSGLRSVFAWAVTNRKMASNPAAGITTKLGRRVRLRDPWFSEREIGTILKAAQNVKPGRKEPRQRHGLKRWVPWLCAYTGARVGEMVQLRKQDVRQDGDLWVITITPDALTVKDREHREVPLHPHLVDMGFPEFVEHAPDGYLFMWSGEGRAAWRSAKNRLTEFVRTVVSDTKVQPNHAWRHTFKTIGSEAGIEARVLDAICGHVPRTVGESYGGVTLKKKAQAMEKFPRYDSN